MKEIIMKNKNPKSQITKKQKPLSTIDRLIMQNQKEKQLFEQEYQILVLSELLIALMKEDEISVRSLAQEARLSPTIIQNIRSGKKKTITLQTFIKLLEALNCTFVVEKKLKKGNKINRVELPSFFLQR